MEKPTKRRKKMRLYDVEMNAEFAYRDRLYTAPAPTKFYQHGLNNGIRSVIDLETKKLISLPAWVNVHVIQN